jgi:hypothetical protein
MTDTRFNKTNSDKAKLLLLGTSVLILSSCELSPILSLPPERAFVPAQVEDYQICENSCGCSDSFSKSDEVINLEQTLIYRSGSACNSEGFCETSFVDKQSSQCIFQTSTSYNPSIVSGSLELGLKLNRSPGDEGDALLFHAYENNRRTSFVVYESESGLQTTR